MTPVKMTKVAGLHELKILVFVMNIYTEESQILLFGKLVNTMTI